MKGKRKEIIRKELHDILGKGFALEKIHDFHEAITQIPLWIEPHGFQ